ncbi:MAG TPA: cupin domain-containing protein [Steroidobacteraceae bacterium]|nr:cupin domain-containing protein [Steroidobacteraceae bacterium]
MQNPVRRVVTGHDSNGKSVVLSDNSPPQNHPMRGAAVGADFYEIWNVQKAVPELTATEPREPTEREFTIMPAAGHLIRIIDIYPPSAGGKRTIMHRTKTLDYAVVIEGEVVLVLDDSEVVLKKSDVVVQRGTDHAWENRSDRIARMAFFHIDAEFSESLLAVLPRPLDLLR